MAKQVSKDVIAKFVNELMALPDNPRVLVTVSHCYIELFVHLLAIEKCKNSKRIEGSNRDYPHSVKIVLLHEVGVIGERWAEILHWFRKKRNEAAHQVDFAVTAEDLVLFRGLKITNISLPQDDPRSLRNLCIEIVAGFWNEHVDFFAPLFMPELFTPPPHNDAP